MRAIFLVIIASVLSILAFKHNDNSLGQEQLMASPVDVAAEK